MSTKELVNKIMNVLEDMDFIDYIDDDQDEELENVLTDLKAASRNNAKACTLYTVIELMAEKLS